MRSVSNAALLALTGTIGLFSASAASAGVIDVQFSGNASAHCANVSTTSCSNPAQTGTAIIGSAGDQWNDFSATSASSAALVDVSGAASGLALSFSSALAYTSGTTPSAFSGTLYDNLMGGYLVGWNDSEITMTLGGLITGQSYNLYVYTQADFNTAGRSLEVTANGVTQSATQANTGTFIQGDSYLILSGTADSSGNVSISSKTLSGEADINGFQLVTADVPEPASLLLMTAGFAGLGVMRRKQKTA